MRAVLLTRPSTLQGIAVVDAFARHHLPMVAVLVEPKSLAERRRRLLKVYRQNGLVRTLWKVVRIIVEDHLSNLLHCEAGKAAPSIATACKKHGIPLHVVSDHNSLACESILKTLAPDVVLLAGTRIIRDHILRVPRVGTINAHTGWLPAYRGRNANLWAFLEGGPTGITTHFVDPGVDTGPILVREPFPIGPGDTIQGLETRAAQHCADLMVTTVSGLATGKISPEPQRKEEGRQFPALPVNLEDEVRRRLGSPPGTRFEALRLR